MIKQRKYGVEAEPYKHNEKRTLVLLPYKISEPLLIVVFNFGIAL
jgi:hypothetical protein